MKRCGARSTLARKRSMQCRCLSCVQRVGGTPELLGATQRWLWCPKMTRARGAQGRQRPSECAQGTWQSRLSQHCSPSWRCTRYKKVLKILKMFKLNGCDVPWRCLFETVWHRLRGLGFYLLGKFRDILFNPELPISNIANSLWIKLALGLAQHTGPHQNWWFCYQISISDKHQKWRIKMEHVIFWGQNGPKTDGSILPTTDHISGSMSAQFVESHHHPQPASHSSPSHWTWWCPGGICEKLPAPVWHKCQEQLTVNIQKAIENGHRNSWFTHEKRWFSIVMLVYQRV